MSEFLFFLIGTMLGSVIGVVKHRACFRLTGSLRGGRTAMRKRNVQILFRLNDEEAASSMSLWQSQGGLRKRCSVPC